MFFKHILFTYFGRIRSDCSFDIFLSFFFHSRFGQGGNRLRMRVIFKPITAKLSSHLFCAERAAHASSKHKMADGAFLRGDGLSAGISDIKWKGSCPLSAVLETSTLPLYFWLKTSS